MLAGTVCRPASTWTHPHDVTALATARFTRAPVSWSLDMTSNTLRWRMRQSETACGNEARSTEGSAGRAVSGDDLALTDTTLLGQGSAGDLCGRSAPRDWCTRPP